MEVATLDWLITLLSVHVIALAIAVYLFRDAPCWLQKVSISILGLSFAVCCVAYVAAISRVEQWWGFLILAAALEHVAVLLYIFRVWWQGEEKKWKYSTSSQNLPT